MNIHRRTWVVALIGVALTITIGCSQSGNQQSSTAADVAAIQDVAKQEMLAYSAQDLSTIEKLFTDDVILMPPNEPVVIGKEAMSDWAKNVFEMFDPEGSSTTTSVVVSGDWAIEQYTFSLTMTPVSGGQAVREAGKGLHIYRRQTDGSWKIAQDIYNSDLPLPEAPQVTDKSR